MCANNTFLVMKTVEWFKTGSYLLFNLFFFILLEFFWSVLTVSVSVCVHAHLYWRMGVELERSDIKNIKLSRCFKKSPAVFTGCIRKPWLSPVHQGQEGVSRWPQAAAVQFLLWKSWHPNVMSSELFRAEVLPPSLTCCFFLPLYSLSYSCRVGPPYWGPGCGARRTCSMCPTSPIGKTHSWSWIQLRIEDQTEIWQPWLIGLI